MVFFDLFFETLRSGPSLKLHQLCCQNYPPDGAVSVVKKRPLGQMRLSKGWRVFGLLTEVADDWRP